MRHSILPFAALALAACSQTSPDPGPDDAATGSSTAPAPALTRVAAAPATAIPERFRGVWDSVEGNCEASSDLRMDVGAVSIEFYESLGAVTRMTVESPDSIVLALAMEGEGERWEVTNRYALSDGGATLTPTDIGGDGGTVIPRKRCP